MRDFLLRIETEDLLDFLEEYAEKDARFNNALRVRFGKPEFDKELRKMEVEIDFALGDVPDFNTHDRWGYVHVDTSDIIEEIQQRAEQGHVLLAFAEAELFYRRLIALFEYQGECEISDEAEYCLAMMGDIAKKAVSAEDKSHIFNCCIELAKLEDGKDFGADYEDRLLLVAAGLVTPENRTELERALAHFESGWREEEFKLIHLEIIRRLDDEKAANDFIAANLRFPKIREIAFNKAISSGDHAEAERLCVDALSFETNGNRFSPWLYKLYSVFEAAGNLDGMVETAKRILLNGNLDYYEILKSHLQKQGKWDAQYRELLQACKDKLYYIGYMKVLKMEQEYALLLEQLLLHSDQIYKYGKLLIKENPDVVRAIFLSQINREAEDANKRDMYHDVCTHIKELLKAGYKAEAKELVKELKENYRRKPAFVDELSKIQSSHADIY